MKTRTIIATALVLVLAGCAQFRAQNADPGYYWIPPGQAPAGSGVVALLYYADHVRELGAAEYAQEVSHVRRLYNHEKSEFRLLQYAMALSVPGGDARKAQQLIEPLLKGNQNTKPELGALARLLNSELAERRRRETETRRAEDEAKRAEAATKRGDELEKQLEAIKNIEKNMIERNRNAGVKR